MDKAKKEILVADDESGFRALFKYMLEPKGFTLTTVKNGAEALEAVKQHNYDLIFLDVHMPKLTGPEVLRNIRSLKLSLPVVILSSSAQPEKVKALTEGLGATACFQKPFNTSDIFELIDQIIGPSDSKNLEEKQ